MSAPKSCPVRETDEGCAQNRTCTSCGTTLCGKEEPQHSCQFDGSYNISAGAFCSDCWKTETPLWNPKYAIDDEVKVA